MRLLNTYTLHVEEFNAAVPRYAILSHRWGEDEVTFKDVNYQSREQRAGWSKVLGCCEIALSRNLHYVWIDTCCIDKSSSAELTEAINSMYTWYANAVECYAYLVDASFLGPDESIYSKQTEVYKLFERSSWFTRGWTLQELIAPKTLIFFDRDWSEIGSKNELRSCVSAVTKISSRLLEGRASLSDFSVAQRMALAATRITTRLEDEAYCLLGIFQVNMPMLYGEGKNAFRRLQEEIIKQSDDQTIFAWHDDRDEKPVLAPSAACFSGLHELKSVYATNNERSGHTLSNAGLSIELMLIPWDMNVYVAPMSCGVGLEQTPASEEQHTRGYRRLGVFLRQTGFQDHLIRVSVPTSEGNGGKIDHVFLDSDVVAMKRKALKIRNRRVFMRQRLINLPPRMDPSFAFTFDHEELFRTGKQPIQGLEVFDDSFSNNAQEIYGSDVNAWTTGRYTHSDSVVFTLSQRHWEGLDRPLFLYLAFDMDFKPFCLISTAREVYKLISAPELEGMHRPGPQKTSLPWLLDHLEDENKQTTVLAFRANTVMTVRCPRLALKLTFEIRPKPLWLPGWGDIWHVSFQKSGNYMPSPWIHKPLSPPHISLLPPTPNTLQSEDSFRSIRSASKPSIMFKVFAHLRGKYQKAGSRETDLGSNILNQRLPDSYVLGQADQPQYLSPYSVVDSLLSATTHFSPSSPPSSMPVPPHAIHTKPLANFEVQRPAELDSKPLNSVKSQTIRRAVGPVEHLTDHDPRYAASDAALVLGAIEPCQARIARVQNL